MESRRRKTDLGPGDFVRELALLNSSSERTARVRAKTDARRVAIDRRELVNLIEANPQIAITMLATLAERLEQASA